MTASAPTIPGCYPPGLDPFADFEMALARKLTERVPGYPAPTTYPEPPLPMVCTCPIIITAEPHEPCPEHEGFFYQGAFYRRCGDSDATGQPYFVGSPLPTVPAVLPVTDGGIPPDAGR